MQDFKPGDGRTGILDAKMSNASEAGGFGGFISFEGLARAFADAPVSGLLRFEPGDFRVDEELGFEPGGEGAHHWLVVCKTGCTTPFVTRVLAQRYAVPVREIGFSGLKDRHAVTTQFEVPDQVVQRLLLIGRRAIPRIQSFVGEAKMATIPLGERFGRRPGRGLETKDRIDERDRKMGGEELIRELYRADRDRAVHRIYQPTKVR